MSIRQSGNSTVAYAKCNVLPTVFSIIAGMLLVGYDGQCSAQSSPQADPSTYLFYPSSPLHLGGGFSPNDVAAAKVNCVDSTPYPLDGDAALTTNFSKILVRNTDQLKAALSLDTKIDASYLAFKGGASFSYNTDSMFSDDSLTVVVSANTQYSRQGARISANGHNGLNEIGLHWVGDGAKFAENCGTRFISVEHMASVTSVIITISSLSAANKSSITAQLSAQGGAGPLSGSASAKFNQQLSSSTGQDQVDIQVVSTGGAGLAALGDLLKNLDKQGSLVSIEAVENAMGDYLKTFTAQNAAPVSYDVTPMTFTGWDPNAASLWTDYQQQILQEIVTTYRTLQDESNIINAVIIGSDPRRASLNAADLATLTTLHTDLDNYMQLLATAHQKCQTTNPPSCSLPPQPAGWPKNPIPDLPNQPSGYLAIAVDPSVYPPADNWTHAQYQIWDANRTRASIAGVNPLSKGTDSFPGQTTLTGPIARFENVFGKHTDLYLFIKGASLEDVAQLSYKEDGSPDYLDIGTATKNTCGSDFLRRSNNTQNIPADVTMCIFVEGEDVKFSSNGLEDPLAFMAFAYLDNKIRPTPTCTDKAAHSGIIAVHLFDDYGRDYHLPVFHLKWNVNHRWAQPPGIGCFWNDDGEMDLIQ